MFFLVRATFLQFETFLGYQENPPSFRKTFFESVLSSWALRFDPSEDCLCSASISRIVF